MADIELAREIARRFNDTFAPVFPETEGLVGKVPALPGTDGQSKMGKSLGNAIFLTDDTDTVKRKVMSMYTDPMRIHASDPGHVRGNPVFIYHDAFNDDTGEVEELKRRYRKGKVGDVEVKRRLIAALERFLEPIRERRLQFEARRGLVDEIIRDGSARARNECLNTLAEAREAMGLTYFRGEGVEVEEAR
jgi:tryptophanyl-tRNA synthetase